MKVLRPATAQDALAISKVHVSAWQTGYAGILPDDLLAGQSVERRLDFWAQDLTSPGSPGNATWVVVDGDAIVGFATAGPCRDEDRQGPRHWEVYAIYVLAEHWGRGLGKSLMSRILLRAPSHVADASLWVLADNERAIRFYERMGFVYDGTERAEVLGGQQVREHRYLRTASPSA
jgi:ribosomal protein S18 acetylase RimI-like enzyme